MLVVKRLLAIFMDPYVVDKTTIITKVDNELFKTTGSTVVELGYMELYKNASKKGEEVILPTLKKGDAVAVKSYKLLTKQTTPPSRYDDSSLLQAMANAGGFVDDEELQTILKETAGLGTSATRAGIIEKLVERKMIGKKGKSYFATQFGIDIIQTLNGRDITSPELTAVWEMKLSQIEDGSFNPKEFYQQMIQYTTEVTKDIMDNVNQSINQQAEDKMVGNCPKCNATVAEGKSYFLCKNYKNTCDFILPKEFCGAKLTKTEVKKLLAGKETKELSFTFKSGKSGKGKLVIGEDGKLTFANNASKNTGNGSGEKSAPSNERKVIGTCPECSKNVVASDKYFLCEDYKNPCTFLVGKNFLGANITETDMKALLSGKETKEKEFTWKSGKKGKAKLKWNGKIEFVFSN